MQSHQGKSESLEIYDEIIEEAKASHSRPGFAKEIRCFYRPEFAKNPENFYPTKFLEKIGYSRDICPKCQANYWRHSEKATVCGDSQCVGSYTFIGKGTGIGAKGKNISYADAWKCFEKSLSSARIPCKAIDRYPVVARWRNDVDYVAAGTYCFQPYCVTGELDPPANPLICPQFCVRFNDLDNIGLTGRHYSGFIMLGIQVFNYSEKHMFFKEECVEFNHRWLTEELGIDPDDITYVEDVWVDSDNCGPSLRYFIKGLEVGNIVFLQYRIFRDGTREDLPIKIGSVGIGLERILWLINRTPTSYMEVFRNAFEWLTRKLEVQVNTKIWEKLGPLSCRLNVDETDDFPKVWAEIAKEIGEEVETLRKTATEAKELFTVLDHTRTILMIIQDGSLPSNTGGGYNIRNIFRRVFALLKKNGWWDKLKIDGFIELCEMHKKDLEGIYGTFPEYKSFKGIVQSEYDKWLQNTHKQRQKIEALIRKKGRLDLNDWLFAVQTLGIPAVFISEISGHPIPESPCILVDYQPAQTTEVSEVIVYNTSNLPETESICYTHYNLVEFRGKIVEIFADLNKANIKNIVVLDKTAFFPASGEQAHDLGTLTIEGVAYQVVNVEKVGRCVFHILDKSLPNSDVSHYIDKEAFGKVDEERRRQLRNHHTATHILFAACRKVLGPHVWEVSAKQTVEQGYLDITHYAKIIKKEEVQIENEANRIILRDKKIKKFFINKVQAIFGFGFRLYQEGNISGNQLRAVQIEDSDAQACYGIDCDNTSEVGLIKVLKTKRISGSTIRLYFVAAEKTISRLNKETEILNELSDLWGISSNEIVSTAGRIFKDFKDLQTTVRKQEQQILNLQTKYVIDNPSASNVIFRSDEENPTIYFSFLGASAPELKERNKAIVYVGKNFVYGILGNPTVLNLELLRQELRKRNIQANLQVQYQIKHIIKTTKSQTQVDGIAQVSYIGFLDSESIIEFFRNHGFTTADV